MLPKKKLFRIILVLIPITFFLLLEIILRIIGYEDNLNFISKIERNGTEYYTINQFVGKRYFGKDRLYFRKGSHDYFEVKKSPNTIRVFCLGASTMAGFPYEYNAIPSEFLRDQLQYAFPNKNIEVINSAIAATNSFTVNEFADVLSNYQPDLFVVYMGQNEFYGVYGVGSTISVGKKRWVIKTYLWLEQFKSFLLIKNSLGFVESLFSQDTENDNKLLMEEMAKNSIRYNSPDYETGLNTFRENYKELIKKLKDKNVPVIISTLVTNQDSPPFVSFHTDSKRDSAKSEELYRSGIIEMKNGRYESAARYFEESLSIDSIPADIHYQLGKCYEKLNMYAQAENQLRLANDLDGLRFRAPTEFNKIINNLGKQYNTPVADVLDTFKRIHRIG